MANPATYMLVGYPVSPTTSPNFGDSLVKLLTTLADHHQVHVVAKFISCSSDDHHGSPMSKQYFTETAFDTNVSSQVLMAAYDYAAETIRNSDSAHSYFGAHDADKAVRQYMDQQQLLATPLPQHTITSLSLATSEECNKKVILKLTQHSVKMWDTDPWKKISEWLSDTQHNGVSSTTSEDDESMSALFDENSVDEDEDGQVGFQLLRNVDEWCLSNLPREICSAVTARPNLAITDCDDEICEAWVQTTSSEKSPQCQFSHRENNVDQVIVLVEEDFPELSKHRPTRIRSPSLPNYADVARRSAITAAVPYRKPSFLTVPAVDPLASQLGRPAHIPWLETGDPLMRLYNNERKRAHELGGKMNRYFKLSQRCYRKQDWYNASEYAEEARRCQREMKRLHTQASQRIFEHRNQQDALFIDLHGMHVDEAKESIKEWFKELENSRHRGIVYVVTGTGHHSRRGSKLRPAVASFLKTMYRCEETSVRGDNKGGVFSVYFCAHRYTDSSAQDTCICCKFKRLPS